MDAMARLVWLLPKIPSTTRTDSSAALYEWKITHKGYFSNASLGDAPKFSVVRCNHTLNPVLNVCEVRVGRRRIKPGQYIPAHIRAEPFCGPNLQHVQPLGARDGGNECLAAQAQAEASAVLCGLQQDLDEKGTTS
ncbi:hypothetical protein BC938DRAFT_482239 [Jimgerdemannia flammicorona]|uniref:Uncharacterized protein n=1 Tax=Jimgerdemannia flammicorona TaxID=994334 RepID=A0A433QWH8_9FUNG|nr:hypothetical protein BC938DRAFT_482239 [Jimgerdemannia flammicorona]